MNDMKIWTLDGSKATPLVSVEQVKLERDLEDTLVSNPNLLMDGLTLVGRQITTEGGNLDLLGVDKYGRLVVFELKRGMLRRESVAQVIDYASELEGRDWTNLCSLISENSGSNGIEKIEDFDEWYGLNHKEPNPKPIRMVVVGLGADAQTERMVKFLADDNGMDISLLTFHGFNFDGKMFLAKQVEVEDGAASERARAARRPGREERRARLNDLIERHGIRDLFGAIVGMFQHNWPNSSQSVGSRSLTFGLRTKGRWLAYVRVDASRRDEKVAIVFYRLAFDLQQDDFRRVTETEITDYITYPGNREVLAEDNREIQFHLNVDGWERHKKTLTNLTKAVYAEWEGGGSDEPDSAG